MIDSKRHTAAVVVLYNPNDEVVYNIKTYIDQVSALYIMDNSEVVNSSLVEKFIEFPSAKYHHLGDNKGIAFALNIGARKAMADGFSFLLTMDQDTSISAELVPKFVEIFTSSEQKRIGLIGPHQGAKRTQGVEVSEVPFLITSASILNLKAYNEVGPFDDELFIDYVDHEYCMRLWRAGYSVVMDANVTINHKLGNKIERKILFFTFSIHAHSSIRLYYIVRNGFFVSRQFPEFRNFKYHVYKTAIFEILKTLLFYKNKMEYLAMIFKGYKDYRANQLGAFKR